MKSQGLSRDAFATKLGISPSTFRGWFQNKGRSLSRGTRAKIAQGLGISEEQALHDAGGGTAEESHRANGLARAEARFWEHGHTAEATRKQAAAK